jgi:hypothetical protein
MRRYPRHPIMDIGSLLAVLWAHSREPGVFIMGIALGGILVIALRIYTRLKY